jgi:pyrimidine operon attenuation protein/uracil phosphoribosyltransferase
MRVLLTPQQVEDGLRRIAREISLHHPEERAGFEALVLVGIRRGGMPIATALSRLLREAEGREVPVASVDISLYRDDAASALPNPHIGPTHFPSSVEGKTLILVDDVLQTRRTVRAAIDAVLDYGRPRCIKLVALIDRPGAELPIQADYVVAKIEDLGQHDRVDVQANSEGIAAYLLPEK